MKVFNYLVMYDFKGVFYDIGFVVIVEMNILFMVIRFFMLGGGNF